MAIPVTRILRALLPSRLYHRLVVLLASLPLAPTRRLDHSVTFRHPLRPRGDDYLLVPDDYAPGIIGLPESTARCLQEDILEWVAGSGWSYALVVVNFGAWQETPFLHVHLIRIGEPRTELWDVHPNWLVVELEDGQQPFRAGRRVVRYDVLEGKAAVATDIHLD